jgi:hypothetical protein
MKIGEMIPQEIKRKFLDEKNLDKFQTKLVSLPSD